MSGPVSYLDIELRARAEQFNIEMREAEQRSRDYADAASAATEETSGLADGVSHAADVIGSISGTVGDVVAQLNEMGGASSWAEAGWMGLASAVAAVTAVMAGSLTVYMGVERRQLKTESLLRATGHSAGFAAFELENMARSVAMATLASTDDVRAAQDVLIAFRDVRGKIFRETLELAQDVAETMGTDIQGAAQTLGEVMSAPAEGLDSLAEAAVLFTEAEADMITEMVEANNKLEAQEYILNRVREAVGGSGGAAAGGLAGAAHKLGLRWDDTLEIIGRTSGVADTAGASLNTLSAALLGWQYLLDPEKTNGQKYFDELFAERMKLIDRLKNAGNPDDLMSMPMPGVYDKNDWYDDQRRLGALNEELKALRDANVARQKQAAAAREASEATAKAADDEKRAADEAERRTKALEELAKQQEKATAGNDLWNDIFWIKEPKRKTDGPIEKNYNFREATRAADARIKDGDAVNAAHWINIMTQAYENAMRDTRHNYDVDGMKQIIERMQLLASAEFGDLDKAAAAARSEGEASIELQGMGQSINLMADSSLKLSEAANKMLGLDTSGRSIAEVTAGGKTRRWEGATADEVSAEYDRQKQKADAMASDKASSMGTLTLVLKDGEGTTNGVITGERDTIQALTNLLRRAALQTSH